MKEQTKYVNYTIDTKSIKGDDEERNFTAIISTGDMDRDREVLIPDGCNRKFYLDNNPVILLNHDASLLPIGRTLDIRKSGNALVAKGQIVTGDALADKVWNLMSKGFIHSISVGYRIIKQRIPSKLDIQNFGKGIVNIVNQWELLEFSVVVIPSQRNAVITACKSMDINPEDILGKDYRLDVKEIEIKDAPENEIEDIVEDIKEETIEIEEVEVKSAQEILIDKIKKELRVDYKNKEIVQLIKHEMIKHELFKNGKVFF